MKKKSGGESNLFCVLNVRRLKSLNDIALEPAAVRSEHKNFVYRPRAAAIVSSQGGFR